MTKRKFEELKDGLDEMTDLLEQSNVSEECRPKTLSEWHQLFRELNDVADDVLEALDD